MYIVYMWLLQPKLKWKLSTYEIVVELLLFKKVPSEDVHVFLEQQANINIKKKTEGDVKLFMVFLQSEGEQRFPKFIPSDLNQHISHFILSVRNKGGDEFKPSTLRDMISSIDRYLCTKSYGVSIINDIKFHKSRSVLKMKLKNLKKL
ncbi:hypothetical protein ACJMK2_002593 [Sinanodonta woodiana]|uniref:Uncharacterized protein n=1 Tax=Sinanodonta woodiana TaxID=1069815 RepID=A0ABD3V1A8_SINWO